MDTILRGVRFVFNVTQAEPLRSLLDLRPESPNEGDYFWPGDADPNKVSLYRATHRLVADPRFFVSILLQVTDDELRAWIHRNGYPACHPVRSNSSGFSRRPLILSPGRYMQIGRLSRDIRCGSPAQGSRNFRTPSDGCFDLPNTRLWSPSRSNSRNGREASRHDQRHHSIIISWTSILHCSSLSLPLFPLFRPTESSTLLLQICQDGNPEKQGCYHVLQLSTFHSVRLRDVIL